MRRIKAYSIKALQNWTFLLEDFLAWSVLLGLVVYAVTLILKHIANPELLTTSDGIRALLADALLLAMGAEFVRTFLQHTPETIVEVVSFAIARHMVLDPGNMLNVLAGCAAVLLLILGQHYVSVKRKNAFHKETLEQETVHTKG